MKRRPAHFMHRPDVEALRKELAQICTQALKIARKASKVEGERFTYDFTSEEYTRLLYRRENVLRKLRAIWNT
jgi:23S rRNA U2552 (ribose-2'-O)-methylase RlmE/FtsJ